MNIISSSERGEKFDMSLSLAAKQRSIHNNYSTFLGRAGIYLEDLYVDESARGEGLGKALLTYLAVPAVLSQNSLNNLVNPQSTTNLPCPSLASRTIIFG